MDACQEGDRAGALGRLARCVDHAYIFPLASRWAKVLGRSLDALRPSYLPQPKVRESERKDGRTREGIQPAFSPLLA